MKTNLNAIYHHPGLQALQHSLGQQDHRTLVLWALETGQEVLDIFTQIFPDDTRPAAALEAAGAWSRGEIKMPLAKSAARETHEAAKDAKDAGDAEKYRRDAAAAAAHAMGQIIGVVHVGTHATAYAAYAVQAAIFLSYDEDPEETLVRVAGRMAERLVYWNSAPKDQRPWARFL